jgi:hypothetical protein
MKIKLYHYSNRAGLQKIDIAYFGDNWYTNNDVKTCQVKRTYYYFNEPIEYRFKKALYCYIVEADILKFYDLRIDKDNLKNKFQDNGLSIINFNRLLTYLKNKGYNGVIYPISNKNIAVSFKTLKVINCINNLKKGKAV